LSRYFSRQAIEASALILLFDLPFGYKGQFMNCPLYLGLHSEFSVSEIFYQYRPKVIKMSAITSLIKSVGWLSLANIISKLVSILTLPILARLLGPQSLGIYNIITSFSQSIQGLSGLGVEVSLQRNGARHQTIGSEAVGRLFGVSLLLVFIVNSIASLGVWYFRQLIADRLFSDPSIAQWFGVAAILAVLLPIGNISLLFLSALQEFRSYAIRSSLGLIVSNILVLLLAHQFGLEGAFEGLFLSAILQVLWSYIILKPIFKANKISLRFNHFWQELRSILNLGLPYYLGTSLLYNLINMPLIGFLNHYGGLESLGYVRVAQSIGTLINFIPAAIAPAVISYLSASYTDKDQQEYLKSVHLRSVWIFLLLSSSMICLYLPIIMTSFFTKSYQPAIVPAWIFVWTSMLSGITTIAIQYLVIDGNTVAVGRGSLIGVCFWILPSLVLIPRYTEIGFFISHLIANIAEIIVLTYPALINIKSEDLLRLRNLMGLSCFMFLCSLIVSLLHLSNNEIYVTSFAMLVISISHIFWFVLYPFERTKIQMKLLSISSLF
jgi:O-antigen/teichoic acid export membrane protein